MAIQFYPMLDGMKELSLEQRRDAADPAVKILLKRWAAPEAVLIQHRDEAFKLVQEYGLAEHDVQLHSDGVGTHPSNRGTEILDTTNVERKTEGFYKTGISLAQCAGAACVKRIKGKVGDEYEAANIKVVAQSGGVLAPVTPGSLRDFSICLLYTSPSPRDQRGSRMPSSA